MIVAKRNFTKSTKCAQITTLIYSFSLDLLFLVVNYAFVNMLYFYFRVDFGVFAFYGVEEAFIITYFR